MRIDDGVDFAPADIRSTLATRDTDGYDGIKLLIPARIGQAPADVAMDIGFGDAVVPPAVRLVLRPFLAEAAPASVFAYGLETVLAEKIETIIFKFPAIEHRLKDILDVIVLTDIRYSQETLLASLRATFLRRGRTDADTEGADTILTDMKTEIRGKRWLTSWAQMCRDKVVTHPPELADALNSFTSIVRPLLRSLRFE